MMQNLEDRMHDVPSKKEMIKAVGAVVLLVGCAWYLRQENRYGKVFTESLRVQKVPGGVSITYE